MALAALRWLLDGTCAWPWSAFDTPAFAASGWLGDIDDETEANHSHPDATNR